MQLTGLHHQLGDVLLWLIGLHVLAIFAYLAIRKNNLIKPMVTGYREANQGADARGGGAAAFNPAPPPAPKPAPQSAAPAW